MKLKEHSNFKVSGHPVEKHKQDLEQLNFTLFPFLLECVYPSPS